MSKVAVIYWSGTGNTEKMANAVVEGAKGKGAEVDCMTFDNFNGSIEGYDAVAFGCPAMGAEVLEESVVEPAFTALEAKLGGVKVGLFGSYGWGDGQWMRDWQDRVSAANGVLVQDGVMANNEPDDAALAECKALGENLA
ncbi:MAG: flavodoxin [Solobacterium sp.]|nr:flavodoxin [Solobacterium sp.]